MPLRPDETAPRTSTVIACIFGAAFIVYIVSALLLRRVDSPSTAYFDYLADAFLHGRLYLVNPPAIGDLTPFRGNWYVPFPPLPALLMLPWVAIAGVEFTNTVLFSTLVGAANVALVFVLLDALAQRGWTTLRWKDNLWLTALFGVGSVHWYMATLGSVWFLAQICAALFVLLALWIAVATERPLLAGTALAIAMLGRPHVALCFPLLAVIGIEQSRDSTGMTALRRWLSWAAWLLLPMLISVALLLIYNAARFGSPFDFGYLRQNVSPPLVGDLRRYGQFNLHYVPRNIWAMLLALPVWDATHQQLLPTVDGMSLLLTTPALVYLVRARRSLLMLGAWASVGLILIPLLTYYNTGWWQFGYRFSLDFMPSVMVLLALATRTGVRWPMRALILCGIAVNAWGVWWFLNPIYFF